MRQDYLQPFRTEVQVQANGTFTVSVALLAYNASRYAFDSKLCTE
jgi:hypothetical protein